MTTHRILIGSILKPLNDTRMYEKIGKSLALLPNTEIHIAGYACAEKPAVNEFFYPIYASSRFSFNRIFASWKFTKLALKVKPDTIIFCTHELLIVTYIYKILFGCKILYDVQENYSYNLHYTDTFPPVIKHILAHWVRLKERVFAPGIDGYLLAEKTYTTELQYVIHEPYLVLENKYKSRSNYESKIVTIREGEKIRLLYSGTIATSYGVFEAIDLAIRLYQFDSRFELTIIGYAPNTRDLTKVKDRIIPYPFIQLIGGEQPVPHTEILSAIREHHIGLLPYRYNKSTHLRIPTKLYEYFLNHLPVICSYNPIWEEYIKSYQAGICIEFNRLPSASGLKYQLFNKPFYTKGNLQELLWEESRLLQWYQTYFIPKVR